MHSVSAELPSPAGWVVVVPRKLLEVHLPGGKPRYERVVAWVGGGDRTPPVLAGDLVISGIVFPDSVGAYGNPEQVLEINGFEPELDFVRTFGVVPPELKGNRQQNGWFVGYEWLRQPQTVQIDYRPDQIVPSPKLRAHSGVAPPGLRLSAFDSLSQPLDKYTKRRLVEIAQGALDTDYNRVFSALAGRRRFDILCRCVEVATPKERCILAAVASREFRHPFGRKPVRPSLVQRFIRRLFCRPYSETSLEMLLEKLCRDPEREVRDIANRALDRTGFNSPGGIANALYDWRYAPESEKRSAAWKLNSAVVRTIYIKTLEPHERDLLEWGDVDLGKALRRQAERRIDDRSDAWRGRWISNELFLARLEVFTAGPRYFAGIWPGRAADVYALYSCSRHDRLEIYQKTTTDPEAAVSELGQAGDSSQLEAKGWCLAFLDRGSHYAND